MNLLLIFILITVLIVIAFVVHAHGEELPCLEFSDGRLAVIEFGCFPHGSEDSMKTISWFLSKGYHIVGVVTWDNDKVLMTR